MIGAQQYMQPQQTAVVTPQITEMLNSMMPLIMIMMVMMMIMPVTTNETHSSLLTPSQASSSDDEAP
jgi:hypothetical protein